MAKAGATASERSTTSGRFGGIGRKSHAAPANLGGDARPRQFAPFARAMHALGLGGCSASAGDKPVEDFSTREDRSGSAFEAVSPLANQRREETKTHAKK